MSTPSRRSIKERRREKFDLLATKLQLIDAPLFERLARMPIRYAEGFFSGLASRKHAELLGVSPSMLESSSFIYAVRRRAGNTQEMAEVDGKNKFKWSDEERTTHRKVFEKFDFAGIEARVMAHMREPSKSFQSVQQAMSRYRK